MIQRSIRRLSLRALIVDDELTSPTAESRATRALVRELQGPQRRDGGSRIHRRRYVDDRVLATSVVPYPPGIPLLMPGESTGAATGPYLEYLRALRSWDRRFPGFGHDTHGVENRNGTYYVQCHKRQPE